MQDIIIITLTTIIANAIGMLSGFGLGTIMTPVLLLFLPFPQAVFLIAIIHWFHDIWKLRFFHGGIDWRLFLYFGVPSIIATFAGSLLITADVSWLASGMGVFLIGYAMFMVFGPDIVLPKSPVTGAIGGLLSGFFAGIFGMRGAVRSIFLSAYNLPKDVYLGTIGAISFLMDTVRVITYYWMGVRLAPHLSWGLLIFIPASFIGAYFVHASVNGISHQKFRAIVAFFLFAVGVYLLFGSF